METEKNMTVPYLVHEGVLARMERTMKRLVYALILVVILLFASNALWIWYMSGFDIETYDYVQDGMGVNIIGSMNGVKYDVSEAGYCEDDPEKESEEEACAPEITDEKH